jgi:ubiquinone/menaquinone biosynthesis C-methylase UbiE
VYFKWLGVDMESGATSFRGTSGRVAGAVMARMNRDMEHAAIDELDPAPRAAVLSIGFGPGVGIAALVRRLPQGQVAGIDPSTTMVEQARRRNRQAVDSERVSLTCAAAESIPWPDEAFGGVLAVNSIQLWDPLEAGVCEVARVLAPGGTLVTITHVWAIEKRAPLEQWVRSAKDLLVSCGFADVTHSTASFRSGNGLLLRASKPPRSPISP